MRIIEPGNCVIELQNVTKCFGTNGSTTFAVRNISLSCFAGELVLLLGPSGSGKTTLLTLMAGLMKPSEGSVYLFGSEVQSYSDAKLQDLRARRMGFIFQNFLLIDSLTVLENVALVLRFGGITSAQAIREARQLLGQFAIEQLAGKLPSKLSQGEKQRVAIARAIANGGELTIADEPTASLESKQGMEIIRLLKSLAKERGKCVVVATHDLRLVECADRTIRLRDGEMTDAGDCGSIVQ
jgi:putative ABC transport system ATP-binding protein